MSDVCFCAEPAPYEWLERDCLMPVICTSGRVMADYGSVGGIHAHIWAWTRAHGPIPDGMRVCHRCDQPPCFELDHLFLCTQAENLADAKAKGRLSPPPLHRGEEQWAAKLTVDDVVEIRESTEPSRALARQFGVSRRTIYDVRHRRSWAWVP